MYCPHAYRPQSTRIGTSEVISCPFLSTFHTFACRIYYTTTQFHWYAIWKIQFALCGKTGQTTEISRKSLSLLYESNFKVITMLSFLFVYSNVGISPVRPASEIIKLNKYPVNQFYHLIASVNPPIFWLDLSVIIRPRTSQTAELHRHRLKWSLTHSAKVPTVKFATLSWERNRDRKADCCHSAPSICDRVCCYYLESARI